MNSFGNFLGIFGLLSLLYLISTLLRHYSFHLEKIGENGALGWVVSGISVILLYFNPVGILFYFLQKKDIDRAIQFAKADYKKNMLPTEQRMAFEDGYRKGFEACASYSAFDNTDRKPEYSTYEAKECHSMARQAYPHPNDSIYEW